MDMVQEYSDDDDALSPPHLVLSLTRERGTRTRSPRSNLARYTRRVRARVLTPPPARGGGQAHGNKALAMQGLMMGFVVMMVLDVALG